LKIRSRFAHARRDLILVRPLGQKKYIQRNRLFITIPDRKCGVDFFLANYKIKRENKGLWYSLFEDSKPAWLIRQIIYTQKLLH